MADLMGTCTCFSNRIRSPGLPEPAVGSGGPNIGLKVWTRSYLFIFPTVCPDDDDDDDEDDDAPGALFLLRPPGPSSALGHRWKRHKVPLALGIQDVRRSLLLSAAAVPTGTAEPPP